MHPFQIYFKKKKVGSTLLYWVFTVDPRWFVSPISQMRKLAKLRGLEAEPMAMPNSTGSSSLTVSVRLCVMALVLSDLVTNYFSGKGSGLWLQNLIWGIFPNCPNFLYTKWTDPLSNLPWSKCLTGEPPSRHIYHLDTYFSYEPVK